jgi:hypothetical protein
MRVRATEFVQQTGEALQSADDAVECVRRGVIAYVEFLLAHEDWLQIHLRGRIAWAMKPQGEDAAAAWRQGLDDYAAVIGEGQQQGVFCEGDPVELAILTQSVMQVQMARAIERRETDWSPVVDSMLVHLWRLLGVAH